MMLNLINSVLERYINSFLDIIPEVTKDWFFLYKYAFYAGAVFIYILTLLILITVLIIILTIAVPVSLVYDRFFKTRTENG